MGVLKAAVINTLMKSGRESWGRPTRSAPRLGRRCGSALLGKSPRGGGEMLLQYFVAAEPLTEA
jgi:hypothetical protein